MSDVIDLKTFVSQTLSQIVAGVREAQEEFGDGVINPRLHSTANQKKESLYYLASESFAQMIEFDVAITASDTTSKEGGGGVSVVAAKIGGAVSSESWEQSISRVKFTVPVALL